MTAQKEQETKAGRPSKQVSVTDICGLIRSYKYLSYKTGRALNHDESPLFDYIKDSLICNSTLKSQEEADAEIKLYDNSVIYGASDTNKLKENALRNILSDEETINSIRKIISELDDKTWSRILSRKRQADHRKKTSKKKITVSDDVFYKLSNIKTNHFNDKPWDVVLDKLSDVFNTINDIKETNTSLYEPSKQKRDDLDKLINSIMN
jgi:hypothetical protein